MFWARVLACAAIDAPQKVYVFQCQPLLLVSAWLGVAQDGGLWQLCSTQWHCPYTVPQISSCQDGWSFVSRATPQSELPLTHSPSDTTLWEGSNCWALPEQLANLRGCNLYVDDK